MPTWVQKLCSGARTRALTQFTFLWDSNYPLCDFRQLGQRDSCDPASPEPSPTLGLLGTSHKAPHGCPASCPCFMASVHLPCVPALPAARGSPTDFPLSGDCGLRGLGIRTRLTPGPKSRKAAAGFSRQLAQRPKMLEGPGPGPAGLRSHPPP